MSGSRYVEIRNQIEDAFRADELSRDDLRNMTALTVALTKTHRDIEGRQVAAQLSVGCAVRIRLDANLRPRYILGTEAKVVKVNQKTATIILGDVGRAGGRFKTGERIRCPLDALELVS